MSVFLFSMSNIILPLVLLNLVIAQISGTYDRTNDRREILRWKGKADLVIEAETTNRWVEAISCLCTSDLGSDKSIYGDGPGEKGEWIHVLKPKPKWEEEAAVSDISQRMVALETRTEQCDKQARRRGDEQAAQLKFVMDAQKKMACAQGVKLDPKNQDGETNASPREPELHHTKSSSRECFSTTQEHVSPRGSLLENQNVSPRGSLLEIQEKIRALLEMQESDHIHPHLAYSPQQPRR